MTDPHALVAQLGLYAGTFAVAAVSSVIPFVVIDVFLVGVALRLGASPALVAIVVLAALGQLVGKLPAYFAVRAIVALAATPSPRQRARIERLRAWTDRFRRRPHLVLAASALTGLPPFSIVATAAGLLAIRVRAFAAIVLAGRGLRFAIVIAVTLLAR